LSLKLPSPPIGDTMPLIARFYSTALLVHVHVRLFYEFATVVPLATDAPIHPHKIMSTSIFNSTTMDAFRLEFYIFPEMHALCNLTQVIKLYSFLLLIKFCSGVIIISYSLIRDVM